MTPFRFPCLLPVVLLAACSSSSSAPALAVDAGQDREGDEGARLSLLASAPEGEGLLEFAWSQTQGPEAILGELDGAALEVTLPGVDAGTTALLEFRVRVRDGAGARGEDRVRVLVRPTDGLLFLPDAQQDGLHDLFGYLPGEPAAALLGAGEVLRSSSLGIVWSPERRHFLLTTRRSAPDTHTLVRYSLDGSPSLRLDQATIAGGGPTTGAWSPDGSRVAYMGVIDTDGVVEAFCVNADGTGHARLSGALAPGHAVEWLRWSPDGSRILIEGDLVVDGRTELFAATPDGSELTALLGEIVADGDLTWSLPSPDGGRVAVIGDLLTDGRGELFVVPTTGGERIRVSGPVAADGAVTAVYWAPDGTRLLYLADEDGDLLLDLFSVAPDGSDRRQVNAPLVPGGAIHPVHVTWTPDSTRVVYLSEPTEALRSELFSALADGSGEVRLSGTIESGGSVLFPDMAPDGSHVWYLADEQGDGRVDLFTAAVDGSERTRLTTMAPGGYVATSAWTADSSRIVFAADDDTPGQREVHSVRPDGTDRRVLSPALVGSGAGIPELSPDGTRVAFLAHTEAPDRWTVHVAAVDGSETIRILADHPEPIHEGSLSWSEDGACLLVRLHAGADEPAHLYAWSPADGTTVELSSTWSPTTTAVLSVWSGTDVFFSTW